MPSANRWTQLLPERRIALRGAGWAAFVGLYATAFLVASADNAWSAWWLTALPAITAGWTYGLQAGFWVGIATFPLDALLLSAGGQPGWLLSTQLAGGVAHAIAPLAGAVCGRLHELGISLLAERERRRELERELQLTRRSLDATVRLLNDQATTAQQHWQAKTQAEEEAERSKRELHRVHVRLTRTALTDVFTELPNRRAAIERLQLEWSAATAKNRPLSCLVVRLDDHLKLRAHQGPQTADAVLRETLDVLRESVRQSDDLFSLGGDEFLIVCPSADLNAAHECAERLRGLIEVNTVTTNGVACHATISIGVAANEPGINTPAELLCAAQQAVYESQQSGRNRVQACDAGQRVATHSSREMILAM